MKPDYRPIAWAFVAIFAVGAVFKTIADRRIAVGTENLASDIMRAADALERAHPPGRRDVYRSSCGGEPWVVPKRIIAIRQRR